ncbi:MAG: pyruvate formate lyase-activating protein, partial [Candidatus Promineifilaceae bacterium]
MRVLCVDIGTGTQDIFLYDSQIDIENGFKLVVPSPTMIVRKQFQQAARESRSVLLTGVTMGGGPSHWAAEDHLRA